jgi:protein-S-isoprenylcysteine O-methyltransferase Ste14
VTATSSGVSPGAIRPAGARVPLVPPPLYYAAAFAGGMLLRGATMPLSIGGGRPATVVLGVAGLGAGIALAVAGLVEVVRHRTTIVPHHPVSTLVCTGAYRISRNPMYTGLTVGYAGATFLVGSWWPLLTLPLAVLAVRRLVIAPEERYLADRFGPAYADYRARVRRWL